MEEVKILYAIGLKTKGKDIEFLRDGWTRDDAFTDDLGHALLFESIKEIPPLELEGEFIAKIEQDEEGGLSFAGFA